MTKKGRKGSVFRDDVYDDPHLGSPHLPHTQRQRHRERQREQQRDQRPNPTPPTPAAARHLHASDATPIRALTRHQWRDHTVELARRMLVLVRDSHTSQIINPTIEKALLMNIKQERLTLLSNPLSTITKSVLFYF